MAVLALALALSAAGQAAWQPPASAATSYATMISVGQTHACAILGGKAFCWGDNSSGELGNNQQGTSSNVPVAVDTSGVLAGKTLTQIVAADAYTCALDTAGTAYCWGQNGDGQLGNNSMTPAAAPVAVDTSGALAGKTLTEISASDFATHTCALGTGGDAYCWGQNANGELGDNTTTRSAVPVAVDTSGLLAGKTLTRLTAVGRSFSCAVDTTGKAYCWGLNGSGQLGDDSTAQSLVPVAVDTSGALAGKTLTEISAGTAFSCALDSAGAAYCWGDNSVGQLGNNSTTQSLVPAPVSTSGLPPGTSFTQASGGNGYACALDATGNADCWGDNSQGQLGNNSFSPSLVPAPVDTSGVLAGVSLTEVSAGTNSACAMDAAGSVYCWGQNGNGQLGNGTSGGPSTVPVEVTGLPTLPGPPTGVTAAAGDTVATISWTPPASLGSGTLTGYTATAAVSGQSFSCLTTSATTCDITGLTNDTTYAVTVVTHTTAGDSEPSSPPVPVTPRGALSIMVPGIAALPPAAPGDTTSGQIGTVTVSDDRGAGLESWTATVSATAFVSGPDSIPLAQVSYWSGPATATTGLGIFIPGQRTAADAVDLTTSRTAFRLLAGAPVNSASWNPTLVVAVPLATVDGTYTATLTHSVA